MGAGPPNETYWQSWPTAETPYINSAHLAAGSPQPRTCAIMSTTQVPRPFVRRCCGAASALVLFLWGCAENHSVAARVSDRAIAIEQVEQVWDKLPRAQKQSKQAVLETLINREVLVLEARNRALDQSARVLKGLERVRRQRAVERLLEREVKARVAVFDEEVKAYYQASDLPAKREVRGRHIMVKTAAEAQTLYHALLEGENFAELARRFSMDEQTADKGGDLGYWDESLMIGPVSEVLFSMQLGELTEPFLGREGSFHIVRVEDERPLPYESIKKRIKDRLYADRVAARTAEFRTNLRKRFNVQRVEETYLQLVTLGKTAAHGIPEFRGDEHAARPLMRYKGGQVALGQYRKWLVATSPQRRPVPVDTASIARYVRRTVVDSVLLPLAAQQAGLADDDAMQHYLENRRTLLMLEELRRLEAEAPIVSEAAMRAYYEEHLAWFTDPERLIYEAILLQREAAARDVAEQVRQGADLWKLAQAYPRFHDAWFHYNIFHIHREEDAQHAHAPHSMSEVRAAVRNTPVGKVGGPFLVYLQPREKIWPGYIVFRTLEHRPARQRPFADPEVRQAVEKMVRAANDPRIEERFEAFLSQLREKYAAHIEIYPEHLAAESAL